MNINVMLVEGCKFVKRGFAKTGFISLIWHNSFFYVILSYYLLHLHSTKIEGLLIQTYLAVGGMEFTLWTYLETMKNEEI